MTDVAATSGREVVPPSPSRLRTRLKPADIEALYRELAAPVLGYLRAQGAPHPERVLGEVFYQVARDLRRFSGSRTEQRRWVFGIARSRMIDAFRRRSVGPALADGEPPDVEIAAGAHTALDDELLAALAGMADGRREVIVLRFVAELSVRDIAVVIGRDVGSVKRLQREGLAALRSALAEHAEVPAGAH